MDFNNFTSPKSKLPLTSDGQTLSSSIEETFDILNSIPRFVNSDNYSISFGIQWKKFKNVQLDSYSNTNISEKRLETALGMPISNLKGKRVLEAGSGAGRFTEILLRYGAIVYSFDYSEAVEANQMNNMPNENLTLFQADIRSIPFEDGFFDCCLCLGVLQHTPSTIDSINELKRVLKNQGYLIIDHYKFHIGQYLSLYLVYWYLIKNLNHKYQLTVTNFLTKIFFPVHWYFRKNNILQFFLRRISPISFYYGMFDLTKEQHFEWSLLDTHDKNTDQFKRHYSTKQFRKIIQNFKFSSFEIYERGNGLECIAKK